MEDKKWLYIGGHDAQVYGPYSSSDMLSWWRGRYFDETLRLRTVDDNGYYTLAEWMQACGNKVPFVMHIKSMEALQAENMNQLNAQMEKMQNNQIGNYSLSTTPLPASTPTPLIRPADSQQQQIPVGVPMQLLAAQRQHPPQQVLLMNAPPPPSGINQPLVIPVSSVPTYQLVQQRYSAPPVSQPFVPMRFPPPQFYQQQQQMQQRLNNGSAGVDQQQLPQEGALISDSPDSGHVVTPSYPMHSLNNGIGCLERKYEDTLGTPWTRDVAEKGTATDDSHFKHSKETQTEDILIQISQPDAERLLSQLLGIRVRINLTAE